MHTLFRSIGSPLLILTLTLASVAVAQATLRVAITQDEGTLTPYTYQSGYPG